MHVEKTAGHHPLVIQERPVSGLLDRSSPHKDPNSVLHRGADRNVFVKDHGRTPTQRAIHIPTRTILTIQEKLKGTLQVAYGLCVERD